MADQRNNSFTAALTQQLRKDALPCLAFACFLSWMFGLYWSNLFTGQISVGGMDYLQVRSLWLGIEALSLLLYFAIIPQISGRHRLSLVFAGVLTSVGTVLLVAFPAGSSAVVPVIGVICTGMGSALLLTILGVHFSLQGAQRLLISVALALAMASLLDTALLLLPSEAQQVLVTVLPLLCAGIAFSSIKSSPLKAGSSTQEPLQKGFRRGFLFRVVALPLLVGLAYGLMQRLTASSDSVAYADFELVTILSIFLSAVIIMVAAAFFKTTGIVKLLCFVAIPLVGTAFVLPPLFGNAQDAVQAVCIVGFNSFYFMVWALWSGNQRGLSLVKRYILGLFVLVASESLGSVLGLVLLDIMQESGQAFTIISPIVVYLLLMAALFSFGRSSESSGQGKVVEGVEAASAEGAGDEFKEGSSDGFGRSVDHNSGDNLGENSGDNLSGESQGSPGNKSGGGSPDDMQGVLRGTGQLCLEEWAQAYELSGRETEVFDLLIKGRNRKHISKTLFISDNTTRTHMRNIYRKLNIHSQQELIDLIEGALPRDK